MVDESDLLCLLCSQQLAGEQVFLRAPEADALRQIAAPPSPATSPMATCGSRSLACSAAKMTSHNKPVWRRVPPHGIQPAPTGLSRSSSAKTMRLARRKSLSNSSGFAHCVQCARDLRRRKNAGGTGQHDDVRMLIEACEIEGVRELLVHFAIHRIERLGAN